jgi:hypothetical protein
VFLVDSDFKDLACNQRQSADCVEKGHFLKNSDLCLNFNPMKTNGYAFDKRQIWSIFLKNRLFQHNRPTAASQTF